MPFPCPPCPFSGSTLTNTPLVGGHIKVLSSALSLPLLSHSSSQNIFSPRGNYVPLPAFRLLPPCDRVLRSSAFCGAYDYEHLSEWDEWGPPKEKVGALHAVCVHACDRARLLVPWTLVN